MNVKKRLPHYVGKRFVQVIISVVDNYFDISNNVAEPVSLPQPSNC